MTRLLNFDPSNALVIEEVKGIILRGPQNLPNGRDEVNNVVQTTLSGSSSLGGETLQATVIQGDGWDFEAPVRTEAAREPSQNVSGLKPKLLTIPAGRSTADGDGDRTNVDQASPQPATSSKQATQATNAEQELAVEQNSAVAPAGSVDVGSDPVSSAVPVLSVERMTVIGAGLGAVIGMLLAAWFSMRR